MPLRLVVEEQIAQPGGALTTRQLVLSLDGLAEVTAPLTDASWLLVYDAQAVTLKKVRLTSFLLIGLPDEDPEVAGALYTTDGALMVSAGPA